MFKEDLEYLCNKLRSGEYDGKDIMQAWIAIEKLMEDKQVLLEAVQGYLSDKQDEDLEIYLWEVLSKVGE